MSELQLAIRAEMDKLNGTRESAIAMMTGLTIAEINELGGLP